MEEPMPLLALPSDVLLQVASHCGALSRLALFSTCQATRHLVVSTSTSITIRLQRSSRPGVVASLLKVDQHDQSSCKRLSISSISQAPGFLHLLPTLPILEGGQLELLKLESLDVKEGSAEACLCTAAQHVQHLHLEDCSISSRRLLSQLVTSSPSLKQLTLVDVRTAARCKGKKGNPSDEVPQHTELLSAVSPASGLRLSLSAVVWSLIGQDIWSCATELTVPVGGGHYAPPVPGLVSLLRGPHQFTRLTRLSLTTTAGLIPWSTVRVLTPNLPALKEVRVLGLLEPTSASVSDAFTWPQSVKRLAIVRFHASTLALMPEISQVEELQLGVLRVEAGSEQEGGLEAVDLAGLRSLQAVRAITGFSPHDRCAWRQSVRLELALPEASEKGHGQCACTAISAALRALPSNLHLPAMALEWPAQAGIHQKQGTTHPCPDCQPRAAAQTALSQTGAEHPQTYQQHVILPGYKHMLAALATSLGGTLTVVCLEAKRLLQGYEEAVALGTSTGSDIHKVAGDAASQGVEGGSIAPAATIGVAEWQSMLTSLPRLQVLGLPDWGRHLSRGGPHTQPAGELLMSDIAQACHRLQRHLEIHVLMGWRFSAEACVQTEGMSALPWLTVNVVRELQ